MTTLTASDILNKDIQQLKEELDDHLTSINQNTDEIENNYSYLLDITQRIELLEKKINSIHDMLAKLTNLDVKKSTKKIKITEKEQELFLFLYQQNNAIDYEAMCSRLKKSESFLRFCINSLIEKGVPIKKHVINRKAYFILDSAFKELQTKKGIVNIEKTLTLDCFDQEVVRRKI